MSYCCPNIEISRLTRSTFRVVIPLVLSESGNVTCTFDVLLECSLSIIVVISTRHSCFTVVFDIHYSLQSQGKIGIILAETLWSSPVHIPTYLPTYVCNYKRLKNRPIFLFSLRFFLRSIACITGFMCVVLVHYKFVIFTSFVFIIIEFTYNIVDTYYDYTTYYL